MIWLIFIAVVILFRVLRPWIPSTILLDRFGLVLAGPDGLARGPVAVEAGSARCYPVAQPLPGVREVSVPADRRAAVLLRVERAQPMGVKR